MHRFFALAFLSSTLGIGCLASNESPADADLEETFEEAESAIWGPGEVGEVIYDGPGRQTFTRCEADNTMHCCPSGFAMAGIHVGDNVFRCVRTIAPANVASRQVCAFDGQPYTPATVSVVGAANAPSGWWTHVCKDAQYMRGINVSKNAYLCCYDKNQPLYQLDRVADFGSSDGYMHTCPAPQSGDTKVRVMSGFHLGMNMLSCTPYPTNL